MSSMLPLTAILNPSEALEDSVNSRPPPSDSVNFFPFEDLDEASIREIRKFQIHSFGRIRDSCRRIPYNTGKRDFYEKTGRTCFEVFQYDFKVPGRDSTWTVMWDYKIGLVRTTPFFKCCDYSKTISAKMLNLNPGLRDISHSITGGAIRAQGYWMPFECARAVCATFCYPIAGALIPLFGPAFPSECIPPNTQHYARMIIDPAIIQQSKREAESFRRRYGDLTSPPTPSLSGGTGTHGDYRGTSALGYRHPDRHHGWQTGTDSDLEGSLLDRFSRLPPLQTHLPTPTLSSAESSYNTSTAHSSPRFWTAASSQPYPHYSSPYYGQQQQQRGRRYDFPKTRYHHLEPDPYRSAVSSSPVTNHRHLYHQPLPLPSPREAPRARLENQLEVRSPHWMVMCSVHNSSPRDKRTFDDYDYDAGESANGSSPEAPSPRSFHSSNPPQAVQPHPRQQPTPIDSRRCSRMPPALGLTFPDSASNLGKRKDRSRLPELVESGPMSRSSQGAREQRQRLLSERKLPPLVGAYHHQRGSPGREAVNSSDPWIQRSGCPSSHDTNTSPHSFGKKITDEDAAPTDTDQRSPSFSGAERVAALTLLHLGIVDRHEDSDRPQQQEQYHSITAREDSSHSSHPQQSPDMTAMDIRPQTMSESSSANTDCVAPTSPRGTTSSGYAQRRLGEEEEEEVSKSSTAAAHRSAPRRGSRDRKRRKGRSI